MCEFEIFGFESEFVIFSGEGFAGVAAHCVRASDVSVATRFAHLIIFLSR